ncbi:DgyrCDS9647 [Dimorphilus gyrociliatus]|uniref:DgyrCDS9647 n=1 Tax=Dimorphilus gyrociliatus TaxID=2664684 RepID=A0A7I8VXZ4_9ANNE|nr:DgyrCDS9647 [Dimorphilus gyrociliatus]
MSEYFSEYHFQVGETVIGLFNFKKIEDEDLTFKMGEKLTIISLTHDKNWYKARNLKGNTGMVPANYIKSETIKNFYKSKSAKKYAFEDCYHPQTSRDKAIQILKKFSTGAYLIRDSHHFPNDYTLCIAVSDYNFRVENYRIIRENGSLTIDEVIYFRSESDLIEYYSTMENHGLVATLNQAVKPIESQP